MRVRILGSAAGGGLPQWNCGCPNCEAARQPGSGVEPQSQSSIAVGSAETGYLLVNASPDLRSQIAAATALHPQGLRNSPIRAVLVTNGDVDHLAGLIVLREKQPFTLHATPEILAIVEANPVFGVLDRTLVRFEAIEMDKPFEPLPGLEIRVFPVPGKTPLYLEEGEVATDLEGGQTVGVEFAHGGRRWHYIPGCARMTPALERRLSGAALVLFDGTVFHDTEMADAGVGAKTGRRMGHMPMAGEGGSIDAFHSITVGRKVYVHINNTNPVWRKDSAERKAVEAAGWIVGADGMEFEP